MTVRCKCFTQAIYDDHDGKQPCLYHAGNCMIGGGIRVYPGVLHLLCRWYVDRYVNLWLTNNLSHISRAWQKKLHAEAWSFHDNGHEAEIYKYVWMLMTEQDPTVFQETWRHFKHSGKRRSQGSFPTSKITMLTELVSKPKVTVLYNVNHYKVTFMYLEKWALAYRHFEHRDTDMNMLMER